MARRKVEDIISLVDSHYDSTDPLRSRMDSDHNLYRLEEYDAGDGYQSYTSNEPQTYADKIISWLADADKIFRIPPAGNPRNKREANNDKERFVIGALKSADERLIRRLQPTLQDQLSWYISLRGWYAGRALLVKNSEDDTHIDITTWDPMHTYRGTDADGLAWACYKVKKTRHEIETQYRVKLGEERMDEDGIDVYDFYDREDNFVAIPHRFIKRRTKHGGSSVPVFLGPVGANPLVQSLEWSSIEDTVEDYGESVFKSTRSLYDNHNFMMSVMLEMTARSRKQGLKIISRDGQKTLEEDPYKEGTEISLGQGEDVQPLGLMEVARETGVYMGLVSGELQRGSIPHSVYGELQFQLSGFAINTLRQGVESVLSPRIIAMEHAYKQICNLITDQYASGSFSAMELSGRDNNRMYFSETITPDRVKEGGDVAGLKELAKSQIGKDKLDISGMTRNDKVTMMPKQMEMMGDGITAQLLAARHLDLNRDAAGKVLDKARREVHKFRAGKPEGLASKNLEGKRFEDQVKVLEKQNSIEFNKIAYPLIFLAFASRASEILGKKIFIKPIHLKFKGALSVKDLEELSI